MPWRHTRDPYLVWLSEVILQQTRVAQGLSYYRAFAEAYPDVSALAAADEAEVMRLWQGLGYYSRARNLMKTAREVMDKHSGKFPDTYHELIQLKGIGDYTASAIASFCSNEQVPVLDGNVFRFLARFYGITHDIAKASSRAVFKEAATEILPSNKAALHNQAIMEFGALQCKPGTPDCSACPFSGECYASQKGMQNTLPVKAKKTPPGNRYFLYLVVICKQEILVKRRTEKDIWEQLHEFFLVESQESFAGEDFPEDHIKTHFPGIRFTAKGYSREYIHKLTHRTLHTRFAVVSVIDKKKIPPQQGEWMPFEKLKTKAFPRLITRFMESELFRKFVND